MRVGFSTVYHKPFGTFALRTGIKHLEIINYKKIIKIETKKKKTIISKNQTGKESFECETKIGIK